MGGVRGVLGLVLVCVKEQNETKQTKNEKMKRRNKKIGERERVIIIIIVIFQYFSVT